MIREKGQGEKTGEKGETEKAKKKRLGKNGRAPTNRGEGTANRGSSGGDHLSSPKKKRKEGKGEDPAEKKSLMAREEKDKT